MGLYLERKDGVAHYALPCGSAPSTHIVKTSSRRFEQLSENEHFCLRVAGSVGLNVPDSFIDVIEGQPLFVIERFDRKVLPEREDRAGADFHRVLRKMCIRDRSMATATGVRSSVVTAAQISAMGVTEMHEAL